MVVRTVGLVAAGFAWWLRNVKVRIPGPGAVTFGTFMHITCVLDTMVPGNIVAVVFRMWVVPFAGGLI